VGREGVGSDEGNEREGRGPTIKYKIKWLPVNCFSIVISVMLYVRERVYALLPMCMPISK